MWKQKSFTTLQSKTMDSTFTSNKHRLFAYCITDGLLDEMRPEQQASIIHIIESLLSEGKDANSERLLSGENRNQWEIAIESKIANSEYLLSG